MKIDLDKPAYPTSAVYGMDKDTGEVIEIEPPVPGMTVREEAWLRFAVAAITGLRSNHHPVHDICPEALADYAKADADAMIAAIEAREGEGDTSS